MPKKKSKKTYLQKLLREDSVPVNPDEFSFCFALMNAAYSGRMITANPEQYGFRVKDEQDVTGYCMKDIPYNRAMMTVREHFEDRSKDFMATSFRLTCLTDFLIAFSKGMDARKEKYFQYENGKPDAVHEALIRAAATAEVNENGFNVESLLGIADKLRLELEQAESELQTADQQ